MNDKMPRILLTVVILLSVAAIIGGIAVTGGPFNQRDVRMDEIRSNDLRQIKDYTVQYYRHNKTLPLSLESLKADLKNRLQITSSTQVFQDPVSEGPYEYRRVSDEEFVLCANFMRERTKEKQSGPYYYTPPADTATEIHPKGMTCYGIRKSANSTAHAPEFEWFKNP